MESKKWNNFKNGYVILTILTIVSISAGLSLLIYPEKTNLLIIRGVGLTWILQGFAYGIDILKKYIGSSN